MTDGDDVAPAIQEEPLTTETATKKVLQISLQVDGLARGLKEAVKALDQGIAHLCILSSKCDEKEYIKLIEALCKHHNTPLIKIGTSKQIGEWAGLCKIDAEGQPRKVVGCSCVVVTQWGEVSDARKYLLDAAQNA